MLEIARAAATAAPNTTAAWITAGATAVTAGAAVMAARWASKAQKSAAEITSSGAIRGEAMERFAKHHDDKRGLYSKFLAAAYGTNEEQRAEYDLLFEHVRLMSTPKTQAAIEALGADPKQFPPKKQDELRALLKADVTMPT